MPPEISMFVLLGLMVVMFWWMSRSSKKMRQKIADQREAAVVIGNNVVTTSGFYGTIVDVDGEAVTLQSPAGEETVWMRSAINTVADLPLGEAEEDAAIDGTESVDDSTETAQNTATDEEQKPGSAWA